jgi:hypothetical protein
MTHIHALNFYVQYYVVLVNFKCVGYHFWRCKCVFLSTARHSRLRIVKHPQEFLRRFVTCSAVFSAFSSSSVILIDDNSWLNWKPSHHAGVKGGNGFGRNPWTEMTFLRTHQPNKWHFWEPINQSADVRTTMLSSGLELRSVSTDTATGQILLFCQLEYRLSPRAASDRLTMVKITVLEQFCDSSFTKKELSINC